MKRITSSASYLKLFLQAANEEGLLSDKFDLNLDENAQIDFDVLDEVFNNHERLFNTPGFGLKIGSKVQLAAHGILSYIVMGASTHLEALKMVQRFLKVRTHLLTLRLVFDNDDVQLHFDFINEVKKSRRFLSEAALSGAYGLLRHLHQTDPVKQVCFSMQSPLDPQPFLNYFSCEVKFNCEQNMLVLNKAPLLLPTKNANPVIFEMAQRECNRLLEELEGGQPITEKIRHLLRNQQGHLPDQEHMSSQLNISSRSLRRHLQERGITYHELVDEVRCELAQQYLRQHWLVDDLAEWLGYSETTNFVRAFKRWTGLTPLRFQKATALTTAKTENIV